MRKPKGAAHHRADAMLIGAAFVVLAGVCSALAINHYTDGFTRRDDAPRIVLTQTESMTPDSAQCLAEAMYYEARGEGVVGEMAIAEVVLHRTKERDYPGTVCDVVHEKRVVDGRTSCQFSFACDDALEPPRDHSRWRESRALAMDIISGKLPLANNTGSAIAYHSVKVEPCWSSKMQVTARIGNHVFYRALPRNAVAQKSDDAADAITGKETPFTATLPAENEWRSLETPSEEVQSEIEVPGAVRQGA